MKAFKRLLEQATARPWQLQELSEDVGGSRSIYGGDGVEVCMTSARIGDGDDWDAEDNANGRLTTIGANHVGELVGILGIALDSLEPGKYNAKLIKRGRKLLAAIESEASRG